MLRGADALRQLVAQATGRLGIIAGGSVRSHNLDAVLASGVPQVHLRVADGLAAALIAERR